jgi:hypothetical protein
MRILQICLIFLAGMTLGAIGMMMYRPRPVRAGGMRVEKVSPGFNITIGSDIKGFACTSEDCYVLTD